MHDKHARLGFSVDDFGDEIVAHAWRPNADGSITIECTVNVYGPDGKQWGRSGYRIRLEPEDAESASWARDQRRETEKQS